MSSTLEQRIARVEDLLTCLMPAEVPVLSLEERHAEARRVLVEVIDGQRDSVRIAVEGQEWVEAVASSHDGSVSASQTILAAAQAALAEFSGADIEAAGRDLAGKGRETSASRALRRVSGATQDVQIRQSDALNAQRAAAAHRAATVDRAQARLAQCEQMLAALDDEKPSEELLTRAQLVVTGQSIDELAADVKSVKAKAAK